jgi:hypothetical protein
MNLNKLLQEVVSEARSLNVPVSEKIKSNVLTRFYNEFYSDYRRILII